MQNDLLKNDVYYFKCHNIILKEFIYIKKKIPIYDLNLITHKAFIYSSKDSNLFSKIALGFIKRIY